MRARECDQRGVHLVRALLLDPVAGAVDQDLLREVRHHAFQFIERALAERAGDHRVARAGDEQRGLPDDRAVPGRGQGPVAVDVAIPVEPAAKSGALIFGGEHVDVGLGQPGRQRDRIDRGPEKALLAVDIEAHLVLARRVARAEIEDAADRGARVALELGLGDARLLEIDPVVVGLAGRFQRFERHREAAPAVRHAQARDRRKDVRPHQRRMPGDRRAPVMADDHGALLAERLDQRDHVADSVQDGVGGDVVRRAAAAEAAHVGRDRAEAGLGERDQLVAPRVPQLRPAMAHQHQRARAAFRHMQLDPVRRDHAVANGHLRMSSIGKPVPTLAGHAPSERAARQHQQLRLGGSVCFDTTTDGTSARSTSQSRLMRCRKRSSV